MKRILLAFIATGLSVCAFAQADSTGNKRVSTDTTVDNKADTVNVGGMVIVRSGRKGAVKHSVGISIGNKKDSSSTKSNLTTKWWIVDLGFANVTDNTNYTAAQASGFVSPDINKDRMKLRTGKSVDVNIWFFMQKLNITKHILNLKYGLGLELNNYRFDDQEVRLNKNPTFISYDPSLKDAGKNKLAADYLTVPVMLNVNFTPNHKKGFGFSAGVSAGYLYSAREKIKTGSHKDKTHSDFDLEKWKISYIGELTLGPVRLYASMATKSMWSKGLDQTPYNFGIRISHF